MNAADGVVRELDFGCFVRRRKKGVCPIGQRQTRAREGAGGRCVALRRWEWAMGQKAGWLALAGFFFFLKQ